MTSQSAVTIMVQQTFHIDDHIMGGVRTMMKFDYKVEAIKLLRGHMPDLTLKQAKDLVENIWDSYSVAYPNARKKEMWSENDLHNRLREWKQNTGYDAEDYEVVANFIRAL